MQQLQNLLPHALWKNFLSICAIPHPSGHLEQITRFIIDFGKSLGLEVKTDAIGNVLICKPATAGMESAKTVILQAHLDMVPQKNSSISHNFETDPIVPYIDGDWVTARDTTLGADNGIGLAAILAVLESKTLRHGPIEALFTSDEETGMFGAFGLQPNFLKGDILINTDSEDEGELFVGCAGGVNMNASFRYKEEDQLWEDDIAFEVTLTGLKGGHSGVDVHLGRANANKLIFRFLKEAVSCFDARLSEVSGGNMRNAIPREAKAIVSIPGDLHDQFLEEVAAYEEMFSGEYATIETGISFTAKLVEKPTTLIPEEIQDDLINAIIGCPNGIDRMLTSLPSVVESSSNLAIVTAKAGAIDITLLVRGATESIKIALCSSLESVFLLAGAKVEFSGNYPGWAPNVESPILAKMSNVYEQMYGTTPKVMVIHAGLECGIIGANYPNLDMVSFGPTLRFPHSPDEKVNITSVERFWNFLIKTLEVI